MNIILVMIPLGLVLMGVAIWIFFWATNHGQFDDMDSPALLPISDNLPEEAEELSLADTTVVRTSPADSSDDKVQNQPQKIKTDSPHDS